MIEITEHNIVRRRLEKEVLFIRLLQWVTSAANDAETVEEALKVVLDQICDYIGWPIGYVHLMKSDETDILYSTDIMHVDGCERFTPFRESSETTLFFPGVGLPGRVLKNQQAIWLKFETVEKDFPRIKQIVATGIKTGFAFPLWMGKEIVGVMEFFSTGETKPDQTFFKVMEQIGTLLGRVVERKRSEERLYYSLHYDSLTGLPNRTLFNDRLIQALFRVKWSERIVGLFFIDLDRFAVINNTLGHGIGDKLLQAVAKRIEGCIRGGDTVSRFGGDEFTVVLSDVAKAEDLKKVARKMIDRISKPFQIEEHELFVSASIGISMSPDDGDDSKILIKNADIAMHLSKEGEKNNYRFYSRSIGKQTVKRLTMENGLRRALKEEELFLLYQPQFNVTTGDLIGMEALVRWKHPEMGVILPDAFIPLAEETGLMIPIGEWVLRAACKQNKSWLDNYVKKIRISVNLSARQIQSRDFTKRVVSVLNETGLDPHHLELELTESLLIHPKGFVKLQLDELNAMGVLLSIDDFGTGYSSLSYLKRFPISRLKIDRSFIHSVVSDQDDAEIVKAIVGMAHCLRLKVVAEGVETAEQLAFLQTIQCDEIQGYLFSRPLPAKEAAQFLSPAGLFV